MCLWCLGHSLCEAQLSLFDKIHVHCLLSVKVFLQVVQLAKATAPVKFTYDHVSHSLLGALLATSKADSSGSQPPLSSFSSVAAVMHTHRSHLGFRYLALLRHRLSFLPKLACPCAEQCSRDSMVCHFVIFTRARAAAHHHQGKVYHSKVQLTSAFA